jgi:hypothetical protein
VQVHRGHFKTAHDELRSDDVAGWFMTRQPVRAGRGVPVAVVTDTGLRGIVTHHLLRPVTVPVDTRDFAFVRWDAHAPDQLLRVAAGSY